MLKKFWRALWGEPLARIPNAKGEGIPWGSRVIPFREATAHFLLVGRTGSGKTISIYMLLREVFRKLEAFRKIPRRPGEALRLDWRVAIFDPKTDMRSRLRALGHNGEVVILHPYDKRGLAWDMAKDLTAPEEIHHAARILFPRPEFDRSPFFAEAAADLLEGVILSFNKRRPKDWTFRDVICAMESEAMLRQVLAWDEDENAYRIAMYFTGPNLNKDVKGQIATKLGYYRVAAAYWSHAPRRYSLDEWIDSNTVLLIGHSHRGGKAIEAINHLIFYRLSQILLDQRNSRDRRTWILLDELPTAGKLDGLQQLLLKGRSKGVCLVLAFQDIAAVEHVYSDKEAEAIIGVATHRAAFAVNSFRTAKWLEDNFFDREQPIWLQSQSTSTSPQGKSESSGRSQQLLRTPLFISSEFASLRPPSKEDNRGLEGIYRTGIHPAKRHVVELSELAGLPDTGASPDDVPEEEKDFVEFDDPEDGHFKRWTPAELKAWGLPEQQDTTPVSGHAETGGDPLKYVEE